MREYRFPLWIAVLTMGLATAPAQATAPATAKAPAKSAAHPAKAPVVAAKPTAIPKPALPSAFAGWDEQAVKTATNPAEVDAANAAALKEYGLASAELTTYTRSGETLAVKALKFGDASGAYGAYSFYRKNGWPKENIGAGAASDNNRVLFWQGNVLVDATFARITPMSGSELRELAKEIPAPTGNQALFPPILADLPQRDIDRQTTHYALGPAGYTGADGVLPAGIVGFDHGAETATATYKLRSGLATLTLVDYPTPQMAAAAAQTIAAYIKAGNAPAHPFTKPLQESNAAALEVKRAGPLVAIVSGDAIPDEAHKLLAQVHYEAEMASSVPGSGDTDVQKTAKLLIAIITLVVVMFVAAVLLALFLGGGRAMYRFSRGRPISSVYDEEFIRLDLE